jgi:hypothetical protein
MFLSWFGICLGGRPLMGAVFFVEVLHVVSGQVTNAEFGYLVAPVPGIDWWTHDEACQILCVMFDGRVQFNYLASWLFEKWSLRYFDMVCEGALSILLPSLSFVGSTCIKWPSQCLQLAERFENDLGMVHLAGRVSLTTATGDTSRLEWVKDQSLILK